MSACGLPLALSVGLLDPGASGPRVGTARHETHRRTDGGTGERDDDDDDDDKLHQVGAASFPALIGSIFLAGTQTQTQAQEIGIAVDEAVCANQFETFACILGTKSWPSAGLGPPSFGRHKRCKRLFAARARRKCCGRSIGTDWLAEAR